MSSAVDLRLQYAAVTLAEELNYARAADRLHITQSALTKQIRELEDHVSVSLFERDKKHVSLLRAGEAFVEEARLAILHSERAMYAAKSCCESDHRLLTIGRSPYVWIEFVNRLFSIELPLYPQLAIQLESAFSPNLARSVLNGSIDLAIAIGIPDLRGLTAVELRRDPLYVAISPTHPAVEKESVFLRELDGYSWALFARNLHPWIYESILTIIRQDKLQPRHLLHITTPHEGVALVEAHDSISFVCHGSLEQVAGRDVVFKPLADEALVFTTSLLMRATNTSKLTESFARCYIKSIRRKDSLQKEFSWDLPHQKAS